MSDVAATEKKDEPSAVASPLKIVPATATLVASQAQVFSAIPRNHANLKWSQYPAPARSRFGTDKFGAIDESGVYLAPARILASKCVVITATATDADQKTEFASATVYLSSTPFWTFWLGIFWVLAGALLIYAAVHVWPGPAPGRLAPFASPPAVFLAPGKTQQFMIAGTSAAGPAEWSLEDKQLGAVSASGFYTAPSKPDVTVRAERVTITARNPSTRAVIGTAEVNLTSGPSLTISPSTVFAGPGNQQTFLVNDEWKGKVKWSVTPQGGSGEIKQDTGVYTAPRLVKGAQRITVYATAAGPAPAAESGEPAPVDMSAAASIILTPCVTDAQLLCQPDDSPQTPSIIWFVFVMGALGSYVHAAASFATFTGNRQLVSSWTWWYLLRPWVGALLAVLAYFIFGGGLTAEKDTGNLFKIAAYSGLVGLFAEQATIKLSEIFDMLFKPSEKQKDKLDTSQGPPPEAKPVINEASFDQAWNLITVTGSHFTSGSTIKVDGVSCTTTFVSSEQLTTTPDAAPKANAPVTVVTKQPSGDVESAPRPLTIRA